MFSAYFSDKVRVRIVRCKYVAVDYDDEINAVDCFTETYTVTGTQKVQVTAPSTSTEYVYIPCGTLQAEKGMTWADWLANAYNTTGYTTPIIKTSDFENVSYNEVIMEDKDYGFVVYELSGKWEFNNTIDFPSKTISQNINFIKLIDNTECKKIDVHVDRLMYYFGNTAESINYEGNWFVSNRTIDFGSTPQSVSKEFYEWFTANAVQQLPTITIDGIECPDLKDGMTWQYAIDNNLCASFSEYLSKRNHNLPVELKIHPVNGYPIFDASTSLYILDSSGNYQTPNNTIIAGEAYVTATGWPS